MRSAFLMTVVCCLGLSSIGCGNRAKAEPPPIPVKVGSVSAQDIKHEWLYSGEIRPDVEVKLDFKQTGYVASLHQVSEGRRPRNIQVGDRVPAGTVLARLRPADFEAAVDSAAGQVNSMRGQLQAATEDLQRAVADQHKADQAYERAAGLYATKAMTRPDYDSAVANHLGADAKVEASKQQIESYNGQLQAALGRLTSAKISLAETSIVTPMPSLILSKEVEVGTLVSPGSNAFKIADTRTVKVQFGVPDNLQPQFRMGDPIPVTVEGLQGRQLTGHVSEISSSANSESRVFNIKVSLANTDEALKVGMIARVRIEQVGDARKLPVVPVAALITSQSGSSSYAVFVVVSEDGKQVARLRSVRVGETIDRSVVIEDGLVPGEQIIIERTYQLADGSAVRIVS